MHFCIRLCVALILFMFAQLEQVFLYCKSESLSRSTMGSVKVILCILLISFKVAMACPCIEDKGTRSESSKTVHGKYSKCRILYNLNSLATFQLRLLTSGDINPSTLTLDQQMNNQQETTVFPDSLLVTSLFCFNVTPHGNTFSLKHFIWT